MVPAPKCGQAWPCVFLGLAILATPVDSVAQHRVFTWAGGIGDGAPATSVSIHQPLTLARDGADVLYFASQGGNRVYKLTADGILHAVAGSGVGGTFRGFNEPATQATLSPQGMTVDPSGNVYISASSYLARVDAQTGILTHVAGNGLFGFAGDGGPASAARVGTGALRFDAARNVLWFADKGNNRIRRIDLSTNVITTAYGTGATGTTGDGGLASQAAIHSPDFVELDAAGNVYISTSQRVRRVDAATGIITTIAGTGIFGYNGENIPATSANLQLPGGLSFDSAGNLYIAERSGSRVRKLDAQTGLVSTFAGTGFGGFNGDGLAATATTMSANGVLATPSTLYIADNFNFRVRAVDFATRVTSTVAGVGTQFGSGDGGPATQAVISIVTGVALDGGGNVYVAESTLNKVRRIDAATGIITTIAGTGVFGTNGDGGPALAAAIQSPQNVHVDAAGNLYISTANRVRYVDAATGIITTIAGTGLAGSTGDNGPATAARLNGPDGLATDSQGNLYIADVNSSRIRRVHLATGIITTYAGGGNTGGPIGDGGRANQALLTFPSAVAVDAAGNLYIADTNRNRVRVVSAATQIIDTVAGSQFGGFAGDGGPATAARLNRPTGVAVDTSGNLYIADNQNFRLRRVHLATGIITTWAGTGVAEYKGEDSPALFSGFLQPRTVGVRPSGDVYVGDIQATRVRLVPNRPPVAAAGDDQILECTGPDGATATLSSAASSDPDLDALTSWWLEGVSQLGTGSTITTLLALGQHWIVALVSDGLGGQDSDEVGVLVRDTVAPTSTDATLLFPAPGNHCVKTVSTADCAQVFDLCSPVSSGSIECVERLDGKLNRCGRLTLRCQREGRDCDKAAAVCDGERQERCAGWLDQCQLLGECNQYASECLDPLEKRKLDGCDRATSRCEATGRSCDTAERLCAPGPDRCQRVLERCTNEGKGCDQVERYCEDGDPCLDAFEVDAREAVVRDDAVDFRAVVTTTDNWRHRYVLHWSLTDESGNVAAAQCSVEFTNPKSANCAP